MGFTDPAHQQAQAFWEGQEKLPMNIQTTQIKKERGKKPVFLWGAV